MEVTRVSPKKPLRTTGGTRTKTLRTTAMDQHGYPEEILIYVMIRFRNDKPARLLIRIISDHNLLITMYKEIIVRYIDRVQSLISSNKLMINSLKYIASE